MEFHFPHCALIQLRAWKGNSRKSTCRMLHKTPASGATLPYVGLHGWG
jgi:hypothetical protein